MSTEKWFASVITGIGIGLIIAALVVACSSCSVARQILYKDDSCGNRPVLEKTSGRPGGITGAGRRH